HRAHAFVYAHDAGVGCLSYMSRLLWSQGYPDQALQKSAESLRLAQELAHPQSQAYALHFAAALHQHRGEWRAVQAWAEALMALAHEQGFPLWEAGGIILRGWALAEQGQLVEGIAQMHQGIAAWWATGAEIGRSYYLVLLAEAYSKQGQAEAGL